METSERFGWLLEVDGDMNVIADNAYKILLDHIQEKPVSDSDRKFIDQKAEGFFFGFYSLQKALQTGNEKAMDDWEIDFADNRYWRLLYRYFLIAAGVEAA